MRTLLVRLLLLLFGCSIVVVVVCHYRMIQLQLQLQLQLQQQQHCSMDPNVNIPWIVHRKNIPNTNNSNDTTSTSTERRSKLVTTTTTCHVFSDTYDTARHRFRTAVQALHPTTLYHLISLPIRLPVSVHSTTDDNTKESIHETGGHDDNHNNDNYTIDIAVIPGRTCTRTDDGNIIDTTGSSSGGIVVHVSGTHGIEGFAGSAIQIAYLHAYAKQQEQELSQRNHRTGDGGIDTPNDSSSINTHPYCTASSSNTATVILIHAFNPYGMKHYRRVNEHNVDLNRNGLVSENDDWDQVLHRRHYNTENYDTLVAQQLLLSNNNNKYYQWIYTIKNMSHYIWLERYIVSWIRLTVALVRYGIPSLKAALVGGQYHDRNGLFYGGGGGRDDTIENHGQRNQTNRSTERNEPSLIVVREWLDTFLNERRLSRGRSLQQEEKGRIILNDTVDDECVTWIDVHTGLGPMGVDTLLFGTLMGKPNSKDVNKWFPNSLVSTTTNNSNDNSSIPTETQNTTSDAVANAVQQGYERVVGYTMDYYYTTFVNHQYNNRHNLFMVQEFGTVPSVLSGRALIVEHLIHDHYARCRNSSSCTNNTTESLIQASREVLGAAFYPQRTVWRMHILQRGVYTLQQAIHRSSHYSRRLDTDVSVHDSDNFKIANTDTTKKIVDDNLNEEL